MLSAIFVSFTICVLSGGWALRARTMRRRLEADPDRYRHWNVKIESAIRQARPMPFVSVVSGAVCAGLVIWALVR